MEKALYYGLLTFFLTGLGASLIFLMRGNPRKFLCVSLGFAGGVMISASFFSLILPSIKIFGEGSIISALKLSFGFILGVAILRLLDMITPHLHPGLTTLEKEGPAIQLKKSVLLFLAVTIHNIPEGLAVGVSLTLELALAIGIQNIPEGLALAFRAAGLSKFQSFFYGFVSAIVEPIFSLLGAFLIDISKFLLPYAMSLAAGAMIFVVIEEILPTAQKLRNPDFASLGFGIGFLSMLILDAGLG
ncbi:MAG: ZIP family metal transporter [Thermodesulfobacterium sp.]|jgi:ZIP family zinc transporter|nr:ZIP family metal transporter [Thermodesulfobacterium sp.]